MKLTPIQYGLILLNLCYMVYSTFYMIIADCDETFNYWEPLNLLLRGFGKQTWECSPEFSIRSYAYLIPYYVIGRPVLSLVNSPDQIFYIIRLIGLCGFTSFCEIKLFIKLSQYSTNLANWWLLFNTIAPGMSHARVALLPSSLAMQTTMLAMVNIIDWTKTKQQSSLVNVVFWYFVGGLLGWPFALALGIPVGCYIIFEILRTNIKFTILIHCMVALTSIVVPIIIVDSIFYQKLGAFIPANIVLYNVFGGEGEGPEIFGVEPLSYYLFNLALNFHIIFPLAVLGLIINPIVTQVKPIAWFTSSQLIIWSGVFFTQPHKEERFLYPIYSLITLSAAIIISKLFNVLKGYTKLYQLFKVGFIISIIIISNLRIVNLVNNYAAPLTTFATMAHQPTSDSIKNVCMGKEWYHFPTSLFLADNHRLRFVDSGFDGLLPGDFHESGSIIDSTTFIPLHMNNRNQFESDKIIPLDQCDYFIDNSQLESTPQLITPDLTLVDPENWEILSCTKILNPNGNHNPIAKLIYIPQFLRKFIPYNIEYMDLCALKRIENINRTANV
ncbi:Alpha-12-mannosyltransferase ALG9 [Spathaspora sp. JA1]|nr:Alpha-12-mannosyltransferase ALG9 [Spathaspora sp. JA1]